MNLQPSRFNRFLNTIGQNVTWRKSYDCPCRNKDSGAAELNCPQCNGVGAIWDAPVDGIVGVSSMKVQKEWSQFGLYENGDVVVTVPGDTPVYAAGAYDRVQFVDSSSPFSLILKRGAGDTLRFAVESIERVFWLSNDLIVEGGIPDVSESGALTWASGEPPAGFQFSLTGRKRPEYYVFKDFPQDRAHHGGAPLPRRVVLRHYDLPSRST